MKRLLSCLIAVILLSGIFGTIGCSNDDTSLGQEEAGALVYKYLKSEIDTIPSRAIRADAIEWLNLGVLSATATDEGDGKWIVTCLGYVLYESDLVISDQVIAEAGEWFYNILSGQWYVYEKTETVMPGNNAAWDLLAYWQRVEEAEE